MYCPQCNVTGDFLDLIKSIHVCSGGLYVENAKLKEDKLKLTQENSKLKEFHQAVASAAAKFETMTV